MSKSQSQLSLHGMCGQREITHTGRTSQCGRGSPSAPSRRFHALFEDEKPSLAHDRPCTS